MSHPQPPHGPHDPYQPNQPPVSGTPYPQGAPYQASGPYPPGDPYSPGGGYPPSGPYPPGGPGAPLGPPQPVGGGGGRKVLIVVIVVAVVALLCCVGGIVALVAATKQAADQVSEALPMPTVSYEPPAPATSAPAPGTPPSPAAPTTPGNRGETFDMKPGDTLVITDDDGTIEVTVTKFRTVTEACRSFAPKPEKGRYLIAEVTAKVTKGTGSINPFYFEWVADDGTTVNGLVGALSGCGDPLGSGNDLRTGSKRSGTVVFDVADAKGTLEYRHLFETAGSWKP
ncbi:hypothetical protein Vqi01_10140 [Micromonospora qiuiae]|uniref:DUF4352 domain-containing protein n=1 Tax=Micromonospora qiuiae TaxID=502268 RepID=A0ABQ4J6P8_9ACTN|nr:DUF4352 domain-containing protein [Micromonospora qiuiae]GIJ25852.1 hypothetical protein Vqi01_10140 [Micromonospora qiuiae]